MHTYDVLCSCSAHFPPLSLLGYSLFMACFGFACLLLFYFHSGFRVFKIGYYSLIQHELKDTMSPEMPKTHRHFPASV